MAVALGLAPQLRFVQSTIEAFAAADAAREDGGFDVVVALHACDTATDDALHFGVVTGAAVLLAAPCCHKELRPVISKFGRSDAAPPALAELARHGILAERHVFNQLPRF